MPTLPVLPILTLAASLGLQGVPDLLGYTPFAMDATCELHVAPWMDSWIGDDAAPETFACGELDDRWPFGGAGHTCPVFALSRDLNATDPRSGITRAIHAVAFSNSGGAFLAALLTSDGQSASALGDSAAIHDFFVLARHLEERGLTWKVQSLREQDGLEDAIQLVASGLRPDSWAIVHRRACPEQEWVVCLSEGPRCWLGSIQHRNGKAQASSIRHSGTGRGTLGTAPKAAGD